MAVDGMSARQFYREAPRLTAGGVLAAYGMFIVLVLVLVGVEDDERYRPSDPPAWPLASGLLVAAACLPMIVRRRWRAGVSVGPEALCEHYALGWRRRLRWDDVQAVVIAVDGAMVCGRHCVIALAPPLEDWLCVARLAAEHSPHAQLPAQPVDIPPEVASAWLGDDAPVTVRVPVWLRWAADVLRGCLVSWLLLAWPITEPMLMCAAAVVLHGSRWQGTAVALCAAGASAFSLSYGHRVPYDSPWANAGVGLMPLIYAVSLLHTYCPWVVDSIVATADGIEVVCGGGLSPRRRCIDWSSVWAVNDLDRGYVVTTADGDLQVPRRGGDWRLLRTALNQAGERNRRPVLAQDAVNRVGFGA